MASALRAGCAVRALLRAQSVPGHHRINTLAKVLVSSTNKCSSRCLRGAYIRLPWPAANDIIEHAVRLLRANLPAWRSATHDSWDRLASVPHACALAWVCIKSEAVAITALSACSCTEANGGTHPACHAKGSGSCARCATAPALSLRGFKIPSTCRHDRAKRKPGRGGERLWPCSKARLS